MIERVANRGLDGGYVTFNFRVVSVTLVSPEILDDMQFDS